MDVSALIALGAMVVGLGSLAVAFNEARALRDHNRRSVQPVLRIRQQRNIEGSEAGLRLVNFGLGPAIITASSVTLDGQPAGQWDLEAFEKVKEEARVVPKITTLLPDHTVIPAGKETYLLRLDDFDIDDHAWFWDLITNRLRFEIQYDSIYGGEAFKTVR